MPAFASVMTALFQKSEFSKISNFLRQISDIERIYGGSFTTILAISGCENAFP